MSLNIFPLIEKDNNPVYLQLRDYPNQPGDLQHRLQTVAAWAQDPLYITGTKLNNIFESKYINKDVFNQKLFLSTGWQGAIQNYFAQIHSLELSGGKQTDLPIGGTGSSSSGTGNGTTESGTDDFGISSLISNPIYIIIGIAIIYFLFKGRKK